ICIYSRHFPMYEPNSSTKHCFSNIERNVFQTGLSKRQPDQRRIKNEISIPGHKNNLVICSYAPGQFFSHGDATKTTAKNQYFGHLTGHAPVHLVVSGRSDETWSR